MRRNTSLQIASLGERIPLMLPLIPKLEDAFHILLKSIKQGGTVFTCGNGGSASDSEHIVGELMKGFLLLRPLPTSAQERLKILYGNNGALLGRELQQGIPALSLVSGVSLHTAFANDVSAELVFAQQIWVLGKPGDVLWGLSTSGNSVNVNHALRTARARGMKTIGLTGGDGGEMAGLCDVELRVPAIETPRIQELHLPVYHALCAALEMEMFGDILGE